MRKFRFAKMSGAGNDFVVIDNRQKALPPDAAALAIRLCQTKTGIGADGLMLLEKSAKADFMMRIFNSDGSEAEMCGNGARCIARFALLKKIAPANMVFDTRAGLISAQVKGTEVKLHMIDPQGLKDNLKISLGGKSRELFFVNTGVPHSIIFMKKIDDIDVCGWGRKIRYHRFFSPAGTNVNFVSVIDQHAIAIRTYERGVENETLACGTGSVASALISAVAGKVSSPVRVCTRGVEVLKIYFNHSSGQFSEVYLEGEVRIVFEGEWRDS